MKVQIVQPDLIWENPLANRRKLELMLDAGNKNKPDLIVLPEMFTTGFSMNSSKLAESMEGETINWMRDISIQGGFAIAGSLIIEEGGSFFNRLIFIDQKDAPVSYDKGHLFRMEKENNFFTKGSNRIITKYKDFSINLQICYDLRFPVWTRNTNSAYDILLYVANWPESRRNVWNTLLVARALENQCYVIGVNRVGEDGLGLSYSGDSVIIDPKGNIIAGLGYNEEGTASANLSLNDLNLFREKFPVWKDSDNFELLV
jgi:omega-amidase